jgi:hypothetical protein
MKVAVISKYTLLFLSAVIIVLFITNAFYVWNWGDDYLIKFFYKNRSPMGYLMNDYFVFDGRSLNPGYIISRLCLGTDWPFLATIIASILLYMSSIILVMLMNGQSRCNFKSDFINSVVVLALLWMALFKSLNEILYWQTGMLYMVELFLIVYLYFLIHSESNKKWLILILALGVGMSSPNAVIGLLMVLCIEQYYYSKKQRSLKYFKPVIAMLTLGLLIVVFAPGSMVRWKLQGGADTKVFANIYELYFRVYQMTTAFFELNTIAVWLMVFCGMAIVIGIGAFKKKNTFLWYLMEFRWLIAAVFSIVFYFPKMLYYIETSRLNCHFVFFSAIFYFTRLGKLKRLQPTIFADYYKILKFPILIIAVVLMGTQVFDSIHCYKKLRAREQIYLNNQGKDVVLKANDIIGPPRTKWFTDVIEDTSHVFNQSISYYYGLKSIRREKYR